MYHRSMESCSVALRRPLPTCLSRHSLLCLRTNGTQSCARSGQVTLVEILFSSMHSLAAKSCCECTCFAGTDRLSVQWYLLTCSDIIVADRSTAWSIPRTHRPHSTQRHSHQGAVLPRSFWRVWELCSQRPAFCLQRKLRTARSTMGFGTEVGVR